MRDLLSGGLVLSGSFALSGETEASAQEARKTSGTVIDAHCHAGKGESLTAPWSTYNDPEVILRHAEEAGIDRTIIFPLENRRYVRANEEIARIVAQYPGKFYRLRQARSPSRSGPDPAALDARSPRSGTRGAQAAQTPTCRILTTRSLSSRSRCSFTRKGRRLSHDRYRLSSNQLHHGARHLGSFASASWSEHLAAIDVARRYPNVYLETSCVIHWKCLEMAVRELPQEKVLFGSDGPDADSRVELYKIRLLKLLPEHEAKVLGGNVLRLLPP